MPPRNAPPVAVSDFLDDADVMLDVKGVARLYGCSTRHVWRMTDLRDIPQPVRVGSSGRLVRWRFGDLRDHIRRGCPSCRPMAKGVQ